MLVAIGSPDDARTTARHLRREIASFAPELGTPEVSAWHRVRARIFYFGVSDSALPATLYGTGPTDLTVVLPVAAVLLLLAVATALFSAARLARLDTGVTLRQE